MSISATNDIKAMLFDFDYTLADSSAGVVDCINYALERMGEARCDETACCDTIGLTLNLTYNRLTGRKDPAREAAFFKFFLERADDVMVDKTFLYEGIPETLVCLRERGISLAIVSTKFRIRIERILDRDGLLDTFSVIVGGEDVTRHKPDPQGIELALTTLQVSRRQAIFVGDSTVDARAAQHSGLPFIAVLSGRTPASEFAAYAPLAIIDSVSDLNDSLTDRNDLDRGRY